MSGEELVGVPSDVRGRNPVTFKLYANGDVRFGQNGRSVLRIKTWPTLRGPHHDFSAIGVELRGPDAQIVIPDEWRFLH